MKRYKNKTGSGCRMCKPHKHNWSDRRTRQWQKSDEALEGAKVKK